MTTQAYDALWQSGRVPDFRALFVEPNPIPVKAALQMADTIPSDAVRLPLVAASPTTRRTVREALAALGQLS